MNFKMCNEIFIARIIMEKRKNKIVNYFILLQLFKFKIAKVIVFYDKYSECLAKEFKDCIFDIQNEDKKIFYNFNSLIKNNAEKEYILNKNNILFIEDEEYPQKLRDIKEHPIVLFYYGNLKLIKLIGLSIVGTRNPTQEALLNTERIIDFLIKSNTVIVSGLAKGIDVKAHKTCIEIGYNKIIGVVATSLGKYYPKENEKVQKYIEEKGLILTEVCSFQPTFKWSFLRRNNIMSAVSDSTIVIEASDTSGTINQARNTLKNGRNLFVPSNVFNNKVNSWPSRFLIDFGRVYKFSSLKELAVILQRVVMEGDKK